MNKYFFFLYIISFIFALEEQLILLSEYFFNNKISNFPNKRISFMKSQQANRSFLNQSSIWSQIAIKQDQPKAQYNLSTLLSKASCIKGRKAVFCCYTAKCQSNAFICGDEDCECKKQHAKCINHFQKITLVKHIKRKQSKQQSIKISIEKYFDQIIDNISDCRDMSLKSLKNIFFESNEQFLLSIIKQQKYRQLTGESLQIFTEKFSSQKVQLGEKIIQQDLTSQTMTLSEKITNLVQSFYCSIKKSNPHFKQAIKPTEIENSLISSAASEFESEFNSKILKTNEEIQTLNSFIKNKFGKLKLLYRASQNHFSTKIFYEKCSDIANTLTLIKTQNFKIIGGYTPIPWKKYQDKHQSSDQSGESFIFSLTNKHKFKLVNNQYATYYFNENYGPFFGNNFASIAIFDKANQNAKSFANMDQNYINQNYKHNKFGFQLFTGSSVAKFKILEWQILQVIY